jgi:hypothetical protein
MRENEWYARFWRRIETVLPVWSVVYFIEMRKKNIFKIIAVSAMILFAGRPSHAQSDMENAQVDGLSSQRKISLFNYSEITSIGLTVGYLTYKEIIDLTDDIQQFKDHFGNAPKILGAPKSTENGVVFGLCADKTFYSWQNRTLLRPKVSFLFGYNNTYDGSSQQQMVLDPKGDTIGFEYDPVQYKKNNFFLNAGCDIGYAFPNLKLPFALYSGVDFKVWYRDLLATQGQLYYSIGVNHSETYYWFNLPLGIIITKPMSPTLFFWNGCPLRVDVLWFHESINE